MGAHLVKDTDGVLTFQSDKYPTCPAGKVPLSVKDKAAQPILWCYAQVHRPVDAEFSDDLETALKARGYDGIDERLHRGDVVQHKATSKVGMVTGFSRDVGSTDVMVDDTGPYPQKDFDKLWTRTALLGAAVGQPGGPARKNGSCDCPTFSLCTHK